MARILAISSQVVSGHVGLSAIQPALQQLGHEVLALPTILLSNHPGGQTASGSRIDPEILENILATLDTNGRLDNIDAVLTGYLPSAAHVTVAANAIARCGARSDRLTVLCDPVIGDDPKGIYIEPEAAAAIKDTLVPLADILTPNRFELSWLSGRQVSDRETAIAAARALGRPVVVATSVPEAPNRLATMAIGADHLAAISVLKRQSAPNGTGDLLAALFLAGYLAPHNAIEVALTTAVNQVDAVLTASAGCSELQLSAPWSR